MPTPAEWIFIFFVVVVILMTAVVPKITQLLRARSQELPLPTHILVTASEFLQHNWFLLLVAALLLMILFQLFVNSPNGRLAWDGFKLKVPVFGDLMRKQSMARFSTTLSTLLRSGVPALQAIDITKRVLDNVILQNALTEVHDKVMEGADISTPMKMSGAFPPMVCYMVGVGEQAGNLEEMLERVSETYDEEVEIATTTEVAEIVVAHVTSAKIVHIHVASAVKAAEVVVTAEIIAV